MAMLNDVRALGIGYVPVPFSFAPNGSSAVSQSSIKGMGITSVTRTDVGKFDVVLNGTIYDVIDFAPSIALNTAAAMTCSWVWSASTKTLTLSFFGENTTVGGDANTQFAAADVAANANNRLGGTLWIRTSSVGK